MYQIFFFEEEFEEESVEPAVEVPIQKSQVVADAIGPKVGEFAAATLPLAEPVALHPSGKHLFGDEFSVAPTAGENRGKQRPFGDERFSDNGHCVSSVRSSKVLGFMKGIRFSIFAAYFVQVPVRHRKAARAEGQQHLRLPESLATLFVAWELAWRFALELGATDASTADHWRAEGWRTLMAIGRQQQQQMMDERPTVRFLGILGEMLARQKVFFTELTGTQGKEAGRWLGWRNAEYIFLMPGITYHAVVQYARDEGYSFTTREHALRKSLAEDGLSVCDPGRLTRSLRVGVPNHTQRVLQLRRAGVDRYLNSR